MQRYKLTIAYRGTRYHGWQFQAACDTYKGAPVPAQQGIPTIQSVLTSALQMVVNHPVQLVGSSRTDAGVHAKGQVVHFDTTQTQIPIESLRLATNHKLPQDIVIRKIEPVDASFSAIRSVIAKRYQYYIHYAPDRNPFAPDLAWHRWKPLDVDLMAQAAQLFVGTHDFASFAKPGHGRAHTTRTIMECSVHRRAHRLIIGVTGTGFLWHMVRIIVGTLVEVGLRRYPPETIARMLAATNRQAAGPTAPAHGLYLQWIRFDMDIHRQTADLSPADSVAADVPPADVPPSHFPPPEK